MVGMVGMSIGCLASVSPEAANDGGVELGTGGGDLGGANFSEYMASSACRKQEAKIHWKLNKRSDTVRTGETGCTDVSK